MSWANGAGFRVCGAVVRKFVNGPGTFAALTLDVYVDGRAKKIDCRAFDSAVIGDIKALGDGMTVEVTGTIEMEALKDKAKNEIKVDGRACWKPALTVRALKVEPASTARPPLDDKPGDGW